MVCRPSRHDVDIHAYAGSSPHMNTFIAKCDKVASASRISGHTGQISSLLLPRRWQCPHRLRTDLGWVYRSNDRSAVINGLVLLFPAT